ncbi:DUF1801 domain-containing protein [Xanthomonadaceae bacterium XH05]|nr:DUF1801 domain-containing protein [Xanthomonadaceae bacterium XH05]
MPHDTRNDTSEAVDALMAGLTHPHHAGIQALRRCLAAADPSIREGVKWNAPSWRTHEYFATTHLRSKQGFGLILHRGAKVKALPEGGLAIADPQGLLKWLAADRAMVEFSDEADLAGKSEALQALVRVWIKQV